MRPIILSCFVLLCTACVTVSATEKPWTEIKSQHFRVITDGSISDASKVAYEFEQLRYVFATRFPDARLESSAPLVVFAVRDEETAKNLEPHIWKTGANRAGEYHHGWEKQFAIVRLDTWGGEGSKEVVYHEYTHTIEHLNLHYLPLWLDEGTAEFYAYTRFENHKIYIGAPTERYRALRNTSPSSESYRYRIRLSSPPLPIEKFISIGPRSPYYLDSPQNQLYYAQAWALVHFLIYGEGMENGKHLDQFIELLQRGIKQKDAFQQVFGDFKKVDRALDAYMLQPTFATTILKESPSIDQKSFQVRIMSAAETEAELGEFHVWTHDTTGAQALLDEALKDDPTLSRAHEAIGFLRFSEGRDGEAQTEFAKAYKLDNGSYLSLFYTVMLSRYPSSNTIPDLNVLGANLGRVLQLNPGFAPAYVQLAKLALREGDLDSALQISSKAEQLEPSLAGYHLLTGEILKRMGKPADAAACAKFVADRWVGPDHDEAVELWNSLPTSDRPALEQVSETVEDEQKQTATLEGTIKSVTCGEPEKETSLVLDSHGHSLTFHGRSFRVGFSDTLWYGEDHFTVCHHLEGRRAVIRYQSAPDASYAGDIVELGVRDDLPKALDQTPVPAATASTH